MDNNAKHAFPEKLARLPLLNKGPQGKVLQFLTESVWDERLAELGGLRRAVYKTCRVLFLATVGFFGDNCLLRAMALTYTTVLSLVPLLAFSFATLKGFGLYDKLRLEYIDPYFDQLFGPREASPLIVDVSTPVLVGAAEPAQGLSHLRGVFDNVLETVDRTDVTQLGALGLLVLMLASFRLLANVENAFNQIWSVRKARTWVRKLSDYLTMVIITPIFLVVAIGVTTAAQNAGVLRFVQQDLGLGPVIQVLIKLAPVFVGWVAFSLMYLVMANRKGRVSSALLGGAFAALAWELALVAHIELQIGVAKYSAIYAGFAAIPIFLVWVQLSWVIVLAGAELAYAHERHHEYQGVGRGSILRPAQSEHVAVRLMARMSDKFLAGEPAPTVPELAERVGVASSTVERLLGELREHGLCSAVEAGTAGGVAGWQPARDPAKIRISDVLLAIRGEVRVSQDARLLSLDGLADRALRALDEEGRTSAHNRTMRELVDDARRTERSEASLAVGDAKPSTAGRI